ncbi:MAG: hypothetical protein KJZ80_18260 [Hyphomicrobiaceae bacterium]|nr:hypothetical protein [Hyphomicrobiaceae bacterium]
MTLDSGRAGTEAGRKSGRAHSKMICISQATRLVYLAMRALSNELKEVIRRQLSLGNSSDLIAVEMGVKPQQVRAIAAWLTRNRDAADVIEEASIRDMRNT